MTSTKGLSPAEKKEYKALLGNSSKEAQERLQELRGKIIAQKQTKGTTGLTAPRKAMRKVSKKVAKELKVYTEVRKQFLTENPFCAICGAPATDVHHRRGRGQYLNDPEWFLAVCRRCHDEKIHGDPKIAREKGYLI